MESTPPSLDLGMEVLPDPTKTVERMHTIVRLAQRDFQFATIYEQRKTNQLLDKNNRLLEVGFSNLEQGLRDIHRRIGDASVYLAGSLSSSISYLESRINWNTRELVAQTKSVRDDLTSRRRGR